MQPGDPKEKQSKQMDVDLSAPQRHSVNDGISKELASLSYVSIDKAVSGILQRGRGTLIAKMDILHRTFPFTQATESS